MKFRGSGDFRHFSISAPGDTLPYYATDSRTDFQEIDSFMQITLTQCSLRSVSRSTLSSSKIQVIARTISIGDCIHGLTYLTEKGNVSKVQDKFVEDLGHARSFTWRPLDPHDDTDKDDSSISLSICRARVRSYVLPSVNRSTLGRS